MNIYLVISSKNDPPVDSGWDTLAAAEERVDVVNKEQGLWRTANSLNVHRYSVNCCESNSCECVADNAVIQTIDVMVE